MDSRRITGIGAGLGIILLIFDGKTALDGAGQGIDLCIRTVIPSLFPFFVLSILLTGNLAGSSSTILRPLGKICGIPKGAEMILLTGFLGGYPVGAQTVSSLYRSGQLPKTDARRMLAFCNNAGPSFIFGMAAALFPDKAMAWGMWLIQILSAVFVALMIPKTDSGDIQLPEAKPVSVSTAMSRGTAVMASVCGWVILFRVFMQVLDRWVLWYFPDSLKIIVTGILELSNGCCELYGIRNTGLRFIICSGMLSFGGLCVTTQTASVTKELGIKDYIRGKIPQTAFSILLAYWVQLLFSVHIQHTGFAVVGTAVTVAGILFSVFLRKNKNSSSIPAAFGV